MKNTPEMKRFVIVDDDPVSNMLTVAAIKKIVPDAEIETFERADVAFEFIEWSAYLGLNKEKTLVLLDLNMPVLSGWEFLEHYDKLSDKIKSHFKFVVLSSSYDENDLDRAFENNYVEDYFVKPLVPEMLMTHLFRPKLKSQLQKLMRSIFSSSPA